MDKHTWQAVGTKAFVVVAIDELDDPSRPMHFHHASKSLIAGKAVTAPPDRRERFRGLPLAHDAGGLTRFDKETGQSRLIEQNAYDGSDASAARIVAAWNSIGGNPATEETDAENIKLFLRSVAEHQALPFTVDVYAREVGDEVMYCFPYREVREKVGTYYIRSFGQEGDLEITEGGDELLLKVGTQIDDKGRRAPMLRHFNASIDVAVPNFTRLNMRQYRKV